MFEIPRQVDFCAGTDAAVRTHSTIPSGANRISHCCGSLEGGMQLNLAKMVHDAELMDACYVFARGFDGSDLEVVVQMMRDLGNEGHFLGADYTRENMAFIPELQDNETHDTWVAGGSKDAQARGLEAARRLLDRYDEFDPGLDPAIDEALLACVKMREAELDNFIDPESEYPVLVTTSRLLSTGVDVQTCRLIVLDREVGSMTEFKQIVGRGTRVHEDTSKLYFTLIDFRGATSHFADPDFDGEPEQIYEPGEDDPITPPDDDRDMVEDERGEYGDDGTTSDDWPDPDPPGAEGGTRHARDLCGWRLRGHRRRTGGIPGRERQARHRVPARLHEEGAAEALRQPRRLPEALERRRTQAGHSRRAGCWESAD